MRSASVSTGPWDYLTLSRADALARLERLGAAGWELTVLDHEAAVLRRPALSFRERVTLDQKRAVYRARGVEPRGEDSSR
jgi:hypothetical protein